MSSGLEKCGAILLQVSVYTVNIVSASVAELRPVWSAALESQLAEEVTA